MDTQKTVKLLRRIRHDFGNHLQVIMGYIDLGQPEEARKYLSQLNSEMAAERIIFEKSSANLSLYLYEQKLLSQDLGVVLQFDEIEIGSEAILIKNDEPLKSLKSIINKITADRMAEEPVIYLEIYERPDGIDLIYSCDDLQEGSIMVEIRE